MKKVSVNDFIVDNHCGTGAMYYGRFQGRPCFIKVIDRFESPDELSNNKRLWDLYRKGAIFGIEFPFAYAEDCAFDYLLFEKVDTKMDVFDAIRGKGVLPESAVYKSFKDLYRIINTLRFEGIYLWDIKIENILYDVKTLRVSLIDFGMVSFDSYPGRMRTLFTRRRRRRDPLERVNRIGTESSYSPKTFRQFDWCGTKCLEKGFFRDDENLVYALGVVLFSVFANTKRPCEVSARGCQKYFNNYSEEVISLLYEMLRTDKHVVFDEIPKHPWIIKNEKLLRKCNSVAPMRQHVLVRRHNECAFDSPSFVNSFQGETLPDQPKRKKL